MPRTAVLTFSLIATLFLCLSLYIQYLGIDYGDKQWEMLCSRMWVDGKRLYSDIFAVMPPLFFWIYGVPAALSHLPGLPGPFPMLLILGVSLIALCIFLCARLMAMHPGFAGNPGRQAAFVFLLCFVLVFRTNSVYFLDREHLFLVFILPYMMRFLPALAVLPVPRWQGVLTGILAGIGFCIKPYCLAVWAGIQLLYVIERKSPRILLSVENIVIYAIGALYVLATWLLYPEYFSIVVPMALISYSATRDTTPVLDYSLNALSVLVPVFLMFRLRHTSPWRRDIFYLAGLCPFFLIYALLNNNWAYTYYPLGSITILIAAFVLWEFIYLRAEPDMQRRWQCTLGALLCIAVFAAKTWLSLSFFHAMMLDSCRHKVRCQRDDAVIAEIMKDGHPLSFGALTIDFTRWTRVADYTGAPWVTRVPQFWMLPKFLLMGNAFTQQHAWILDYVANAYADDINANKPDIMFVDDTDVFYSALKNVDLVGLFSANPRFRESFQHYSLAKTLDLCGPPGTYTHKVKCSYRVYRRKD